jgi:membrane protein
MYIALPNTYVDWKPALIGSLTAGTLFQTARFIFSHYLGLGFDDRHTQIYGVLSSIIIFAIWVYLVWLIVILGAEITNIVQKYQAGGFRDLNPHFGRNSEDLLVNPMLAVQIFLAIASRFAEAETACSKSDLLKAGFSSDLVDQVVDKLKSSGILYETKEDLIIPAKPLSRISLVDVLTTFDWHYIIQDDARYSSNLRQALEQLRQIHSQILGTESIEYYLPEGAEPS